MFISLLILEIPAYINLNYYILPYSCKVEMFSLKVERSDYSFLRYYITISEYKEIRKRTIYD